jgi:hypothetical protein
MAFHYENVLIPGADRQLCPFDSECAASACPASVAPTPLADETAINAAMLGLGKPRLQALQKALDEMVMQGGASG